MKGRNCHYCGKMLRGKGYSKQALRYCCEECCGEHERKGGKKKANVCEFC